MAKRMPDLPVALEAAKPYIEALDAAGVPYSLTPEWEEDTGNAIGINVSVDAMGCDGWAKWVVIPFRDDKDDHGDGFIMSGWMFENFERTSFGFEALAKSLAMCRRSEKKAEVRYYDEGLPILSFSDRYPF